MALYVVDTHALLWYLGGSPLVSPVARAALDEAATALRDIHDRLIVAEAQAAGAALISRDEAITASGLVHRLRAGEDGVVRSRPFRPAIVQHLQ